MSLLVLEDKGITLVSYLGKGGPIATGKTFEEAKVKYDNMFILAKAVQKIISFRGGNGDTQQS
jgi:hypothetical protein